MVLAEVNLDSVKFWYLFISLSRIGNKDLAKTLPLLVFNAFQTSHSMKLEGQENPPKRIKENIVQRTNQIKNESLKNLWN